MSRFTPMGATSHWNPATKKKHTGPPDRTLATERIVGPNDGSGCRSCSCVHVLRRDWESLLRSGRRSRYRVASRGRIQWSCALEEVVPRWSTRRHASSRSPLIQSGLPRRFITQSTSASFPNHRQPSLTHRVDLASRLVQSTRRPSTLLVTSTPCMEPTLAYLIMLMSTSLAGCFRKLLRFQGLGPLAIERCKWLLPFRAKKFK